MQLKTHHKTEFKIIKHISIVCLFILCICILTGCTLFPSTKPYSKRKTKKLIKETCDEKFKIVDKKELNDSPRVIEYTCELKDRDLTFTAKTSWQPGYFVYYKDFHCDYLDKIADLYKPDIRDLFEQEYAPLVKSNWLPIYEYKDIEAIAKELYSANQIYSKEAQYHKDGFLKQHPVMDIKIVYYPSEEAFEQQSIWVMIDSISIDGVTSEEEYKERLTQVYMQAHTTGIINDETIPADKLSTIDPNKYPAIYQAIWEDKIRNGQTIENHLRQQPD